jgi:hypothetical protein
LRRKVQQWADPKATAHSPKVAATLRISGWQ